MAQDHFDNQTQKSKRERARDLIRALLAKTVERGASEEEAMAAAAKAAELMSAYNVSATDAADVRDDQYGYMKRQYAKSYTRRVRFHEATDLLIGSIARFCGTRSLWDGSHIGYFGQKHDCELSHWLLDLFINCSEADWQGLRKKKRFDIDPSIAGRKSFMRGYVHRMSNRLRDIREARKAQEQAAAPQSQNALVVLKQQVVQERYKQWEVSLGGFGTKRGGYRSGAAHGGNYDAGKASADRTNITTGVGSKRVGAIR